MDDALAAYAEALLERADAENVPSGILHWSLLEPYRIGSFDGAEWRGECDQALWQQLYHELHGGVKRDTGMPSLAQLGDSLTAWHLRDEVPIAVACYRYDTPKRTFVARVVSMARKNEVLTQPESTEGILEQKTAFFASALLPARSQGFDFLPYEHAVPDVTFVVPRELFLSNIDGEPSNVEIDFDDGEGFRGVSFGERVLIHYGDELPKQLRLRLHFDGRTLGASFAFRVSFDIAPEHETWPFPEADVRPYKGIRGSGWAWVFRRKNHNNDIVNPMIFADGFGKESSDVHTFWRELNKLGLAQKLRDEGKDLILVGYHRRSNYIQANALLVVSVIERTLSERKGINPLVVAGASMGGLVTRYALLWMDDQKPPIPHHAKTYLSYDTPHDGAWIPIIVQKFAHYFAPQNAEAAQQSLLMKSPAAQQLLWAWSEKQDSTEFFKNELRKQFLDEIRTMGGMPPVRRYAVANGAADGLPDPLAPPDTVAVQWVRDCAGAILRTQPVLREKQDIGECRVGGDHLPVVVNNIPPFDSVPGGKSRVFQQVAEGTRRDRGTTKNDVRVSCFIPTVSALGASLMARPLVPVSAIPRKSIPFDDFITARSNMMHVDVSPELRDWVVARCTKTEEAAQEPG